MARGRRHLTREILGDAQATAVRTKIRAEIALIDREVHRQQSEFGVALFDAIVNHLLIHTKEEPPLVFRVHGVQSAYDQCHAEVQAKGSEIDAKELQMDSIQVNRERSPPPTTTVLEKVQYAGVWATDTALLAKLTLESKLLVRDIRLRKEQFGVEVFDTVIASSSNGQQQNFPENLESDGEITKLIQSASATIAIVYENRDSKQRELTAMLDEGVL